METRVKGKTLKASRGKDTHYVQGNNNLSDGGPCHKNHTGQTAVGGLFQSAQKKKMNGQPRI